MVRSGKIYVLFFLIFTVIFVSPLSAQNKKEKKVAFRIYEKLKGVGPFFDEHAHLGKFRLDSVKVDIRERKIGIYFNKDVSYIPFRENIIADEECRLKSTLGWYFRKYDIEMFSDEIPVVDFVPNYYRSILEIDSTHFPQTFNKKTLFYKPSVHNFNKGLNGKHIALWPSHGKYYERTMGRWEWQRARLHSSVEDLFTVGYVLPYLTKMLENAGAITLIPRERGIQKKQVIIDNDLSSQNSILELNRNEFSFEHIERQGFLHKKVYISTENPFRLGSYLKAKSKSYWEEETPKLVARYVPEIPETGNYAVYISYGQNPAQVSPVEYHILSENGVDTAMVDQSIGFNTWIYIGHYDFHKGIRPATGAIEVYSADPSEIITLDAIRIGGGMGKIARGSSNRLSTEKDLNISKSANDPHTNMDEWETSESPAFMEAARYYLQYSGMPDTLVYHLNQGKNDYKDDYQCRGEWVNYISGSPISARPDGSVEGLGIPIDLALAFHTDAGVTQNDSIIGTLAIFNTYKDSTFFPDGRSKMVNRELSDIIQSQIVDDIRLGFNSDWTRRGLWDKPYSEAYRANVPSILLELLSHQNLADMTYGLDPNFKFHVSRAIYKGILKFMAFQNNTEYVVQPLPVDHFKISGLGGKKVELSWQPVEDSIEPSAMPDYYEIHIRKNDGAFKVLRHRYNSTVFDYELPEYGEIYSFKIIAVNEGGKSFPGEILSCGIHEHTDNEALIVNAFDRISSPAIIDLEDFAGIAHWEDTGVNYINDISTTGMPYDFDRNSPWLDDDSPGWGASHANLEGRIINGNSFDYTYCHGKAMFENGYSFVSQSDEYFVLDDRVSGSIILLDIIFGEEKTTNGIKNEEKSYTVYTPEMMKALKLYAENDVPVLITGAYVGSDMVNEGDSSAIQFCSSILGYSWRSDKADRMGFLNGTGSSSLFSNTDWVYNAGYHTNHYTVESPDAIEPAITAASCIIRYRNSKSCAATAMNKPTGVIVMGFPFESVLSEKARNQLMGRIISYLLTD